MLQLNYDLAKYHCDLLTGQSGSRLTFQFFYDPKNEAKRPDLARHFTATLDEAWDSITNAQNDFCGIYIGVNETDGKGRENHNVTKYRALFVDFDGVSEPRWVIKPSFITKRDDTHGHAYWLLNDGEITEAEDFKKEQKRLALFYGTDQQVTDPARVLRLCGTLHLKNPANPATYYVANAVNHHYSIKELTAAHTLPPETDALLNQWVENRKGIQTGDGYNDNPRYREQFIHWLINTAPPAIEGSGSHTLFKVTGWAHDRGIKLDTAKQLLWEHYNPRCIPPWQEYEQHLFFDVVENAYNYATSAPGCKTTTALFSSLGELPPPVDGWQSNKKIIEPVKATGNYRDSHRIGKDKGEILLAQLTAKSGHYDLAVAFDAVAFDGRTIIRSEKCFYVFNGKSWSEQSDPMIKSMIQRFYSEFKPADSFTRGVFSVFCDLVNVKAIRNGMWLSNPEKSGTDVVVFQNGLVDFSGTPPYTLQPHTNDFFTFNEVNYDYDMGATCPEWDKFCETIWPGNTLNKMLLEEWLGYLLTSSVDLQKYMLLIGYSRAGKGVITKVISLLVGEENTCSPSLSNITKDSTLHSMSLKKVAFIPDAHSVNRNLRDSTLSMFKAITGGDTVTFHKMYAGAQTALITSRITISTNNMPDFVDSSGALANRTLALRFDKSFAGREDFGLYNRLAKEVKGIAQKAINGYIRLRLNKGVFTESEQSKIEREDMREDMFPLSEFVSRCCEMREGAVTTVDALFNVYIYYCTIDGVKHPYTKIQFSKVLRSSSLPIRMVRPYDDDGKRIRAFDGIRIASKLIETIGFSDVNEV